MSNRADLTVLILGVLITVVASDLQNDVNLLFQLVNDMKETGESTTSYVCYL